MKRIWILVAAAALLLGAFVLLSYMDNRTRAASEGQRELAARAQLVATAVDRVLEWRTFEILTFVALPSLRGFAASDETARPSRTAIALAELQAIVAADPNIRSAAITNQAGYVILATDATMNSDWSNRVFVREALAGHLYGSPTARESGQVSQYYSGPLVDNAGQVAGALVMRVAIQEMWDILKDQPNVWIVDENGVKIADSSDKPKLFSSLVPLSGDVAADMAAEERYGNEVEQIRSANMGDLAKAIQKRDKEGIFRDTDGQVIHAAIRPLKNNPWTVVVFEREDVVFAPALGAFVDQMKVGGIALLLGGALMYAYLRWLGAEKRRT